ncbi:MAG: 50S ribosomal protein L21e [Methanosarcinales archaeon]|nr:50S ribosomal protein L21e [Methanosarcinales archaeon]
MAKSHGIHRKSRDKLSKSVRARGISPVIRAIQDFEVGSRVHIIIDPSIHKGMPHPRYHGTTAKVLGKRGRAYLLDVTDGNASKTVIAFPEHLMAQK